MKVRPRICWILTTRLGRQLRAELGLAADAPTSSRWPAASAMREYSEGLAALRRGDPMAARDISKPQLPPIPKTL